MNYLLLLFKTISLYLTMLGISTAIIVFSLGVSVYSAATTAAMGCIAKTIAGLIHSEIFNRIAKNA